MDFSPFVLLQASVICSDGVSHNLSFGFHIDFLRVGHGKIIPAQQDLVFGSITRLSEISRSGVCSLLIGFLLSLFPNSSRKRVGLSIHSVFVLLF